LDSVFIAGNDIFSVPLSIFIILPPPGDIMLSLAKNSPHLFFTTISDAANLSKIFPTISPLSATTGKAPPLQSGIAHQHNKQQQNTMRINTISVVRQKSVHH
jgi:hypothetical protein